MYLFRPAVLGVPVPLQVSDEDSAEMAIGLLPAIESHILAEPVS
jgi:hypothetical protein